MTHLEGATEKITQAMQDLWHSQYIYMLLPAHISNEEGLRTLFMP